MIWRQQTQSRVCRASSNAINRLHKPIPPCFSVFLGTKTNRKGNPSLSLFEAGHFGARMARLEYVLLPRWSSRL